jgi:aspartyl-tRNA(Asn)/glutamyl-tRNA(Gln) amidotransferase subunit B
MNVIKRGGKVKHETRGWDAKAGISKLMRAKETEEEYGYIADPDLTKQEISKELIDKLKKEIPELPDKKLRRFMRQYHVSNKIAEALVSDLGIADLFEHVAKRVGPRIAGSWIAGPLLKTLNWHGLRLRDSGIKKEWITELLLDFSKKKFTDRITEEILRKLVEEKKSPAEIIKKYGLKKIERLEEIESIVADVLERNQRAVDDFRSGKREALHFLIGQVIRSSKGAISATKARKVLLELLG